MTNHGGCCDFGVGSGGKRGFGHSAVGGVGGGGLRGRGVDKRRRGFDGGRGRFGGGRGRGDY